MKGEKRQRGKREKRERERKEKRQRARGEKESERTTVLCLPELLLLFIAAAVVVNCLEAFPVDDSGSRFIVLLLGDPHLLEGGEGGQD